MNSPLQPIDPARATVRASDMDREQIATLLRDNYAEGRLTYDELQERLESAYAAKTLGELDVLTHDLPQATSPTPPPAATPVVTDPNRAKRIRDRVLTYVLLMLFLIAIWAATGMNGSFWPIWPIIIGGLILAFDVLGLEHPRGRRRRLERNRRRAERWERRSGKQDEEE